jgi:hypothetical protein
MHITVIVAVPLGLAMLTGCRLDPLVPDTPGASVHILPDTAEIPPIEDNGELAKQIEASDGIEDNKVIPLLRGNGGGVRYWSFGAASTAPGARFELVVKKGDGTYEPLMHPPVVNAIPGDPGYNPVQVVQQVVMIGDYKGKLFPSVEALADAAALGYVDETDPGGPPRFVTAPIVPADTLIEVGDMTSLGPSETVYARGYAVQAYRFGGDFAEQPAVFGVPTRDVSFLRAPRDVNFNLGNLIFQATVPTMPPPATGAANYSALSRVIEVDLADNAEAITSDGQLFLRNGFGQLTMTTANVERHEVTTDILVLQLQFTAGAL